MAMGKVCGGNRTRHGADTQQVLASVVRKTGGATGVADVGGHGGPSDE